MDNAQLAVRVQRLEDVAFEGHGLLEAVQHLGENAGALADALHQVDRQQQTLSAFSERLTAVQATAVPREEFERTKQETAEERAQFARAALRRTWVLFGLVVFGAVIAMLVLDVVLDERRARQLRVCELRNTQTELIVQTLRERGLAEDADRFTELVIDCNRELLS